MADEDDDVRLLVDETPAGEEPVAVGDSRQKHVSVTTADGRRHEHGDVYLKHSAAAFVVSTDPGFPDDATTRFEKADLRRVEVTQHHAACFITTAAAGEGPTLDALRGFRDDALARLGRALVGGYYAVSPPVARTLARHPRSGTTAAVRWHVERCAALARRRTASERRGARLALSVVLTLAYALGVGLALVGSAWLGLREAVARRVRGGRGRE